MYVQRKLKSVCILITGMLLTAFSFQSVYSQQMEQPQFIYVCNQGDASVSVINSETHEITETVDLQALGFSANAKPHHAIAEPDGSFWYVTLIGENRVLKFNRQNKLVDSAELEVPGLMAMHPQKGLLYVGRSMSAVNPPQSFGVVRRADMEVMQEPTLFFTRPHAIATTPDGAWTFIGSLSANQILSLNNDNQESDLTNLDGQTQMFVNFAVSPDGNTMVATGQMTGQILVFDITNPVSPQVIDTVSVGAQPWHPVFSPDGNLVYFGNKGAHTVTVLDMNSRTVKKVIEGEGLAQPHGAALTANGKYLFVSNNNRQGTYNPDGRTEGFYGTVTVINTETHKIERVIEVGSYATGIGTNAY